MVFWADGRLEDRSAYRNFRCTEPVWGLVKEPTLGFRVVSLSYHNRYLE